MSELRRVAVADDVRNPVALVGVDVTSTDVISLHGLRFLSVRSFSIILSGFVRFLLRKKKVSGVHCLGLIRGGFARLVPLSTMKERIRCR